MCVSGHFKTLAAMAAAVSMSAAGAFAQGANTAYVPFVVNANATVTAVQGAEVVSITVTANEEKVLVLSRGTISVLNPGGTRERLNAPMVTGSRGNITLRLPPQSYQNAEIALHSVNGKRVLRAKTAVSEAASAISRRNVAAGVYLLSVKGTNGGAFTTRLTHGGGNLNISVAFGTGSVSPERRLEKQAADGDWGITVAADGYITYTYTLRPVVGINETQIITLDPAPQAQTYTITFNQNYTGAPAATTTRTGTDGKLASLPTPTRSSYTFNGWWTVSAATGGTQVTTGTTFSADAAVYARWEEGAVQPTNYTLTVSRNPTTGGNVSVKVGTGTVQSNPAAQSVASGVSVIVTATPSTGYTFVNWTAATGTTLPTGITATAATGTFTINGNVNITANFKTEDVTPPSGGTFTDSRDGKSYRWVQIGTQTWMGENLNYNASGSKCYNNSADSCAKYGRLYNWETAMNGASSSSLSPSGVQGVCPAGWHLPSHDEWTTLENYVGGASTAGTKLKSSTGWNSSSGVPAGTDQYGFSALPGGNYYPDEGFNVGGNNGYWWSASATASTAWYRYMYYYYENVGRLNNSKTYLLSVRCVQDEEASVQPTAYTITFNQNYTGAPTVTTAKTGTEGKLASLPTPTRTGYTFNGWWTVSAATGGTQVTTGTTFSADAAVYARWTVEPVTLPSGNTFTDSRDGKTYKKVTIGTQTWMGENLNYFASGSTCYKNSADSCAKYGRLYNWATAMNGASSSSLSPSGVQGACPVGWHIPSDAEWTTLTDFVGSNAGTKLKSSTGWNWNSYIGVPAGTDDFGWSALPGGRLSDGGFNDARYYGYWWSATVYVLDLVRNRDMSYGGEYVERDVNNKADLFSVRCVQD